MHVCTYVCIYMYICICTYVYKCVHTVHPSKVDCGNKTCLDMDNSTATAVLHFTINVKLLKHVFQLTF